MLRATLLIISPHPKKSSIMNHNHKPPLFILHLLETSVKLFQTNLVVIFLGIIMIDLQSAR